MTAAPRLVNRYTGIEHAEAQCQDCDWHTYQRKNALATASLHARRTGHAVRAMQAVIVFYNKRDDMVPTR